MDQKGGLKYKNPDFVLDFWFGAEWFRRIVGHSKMKSGSFNNCFFGFWDVEQLNWSLWC